MYTVGKHVGRDYMIHNCDKNTTTCYIGLSEHMDDNVIHSVSANGTMTVILNRDDSLATRILDTLKTKLR